MTEWLGRLIGVDNLRDVESMRVGFAAPWAESRPALVLFALIGVVILSILFYARFQRTAPGRARTVLMLLRAVVLGLLIAILAEPTLIADIRATPKSLLLVLFDGSESMSFQDKIPGDTIQDLAKIVRDERGNPISHLDGVSRQDLVKKVLASPQNKALEELSKRYRIRAYEMDKLNEVRELGMTRDSEEGGDDAKVDPAHLASQLGSGGRVTAIGAALDDLSRRHRRHIAGIVVVSDFDQNSGRDAVDAAEALRRPVYTVGVGPREVIDLAVELQSAIVMKKDEDSEVTVNIRQSGLMGRVARVQLMGRRLGSTGEVEAQTDPLPIAPARTVEITGEFNTVSIPFTPGVEGRYLLVAQVDAFDDEVLTENNTAEREVTVHDESLKLLFVEYEPTWEWRFVKEVFHRDKLIGRDGFRTFLRSADFKVRRSNELFLETLLQPRNAFFANDVLFLSDIPSEMLSDHFQELVREFVYDFGGGLVIVAGPRFGPQALANTKIADMLPVVVDSSSRPRIVEFTPQFTPRANSYSFMQLGSPGDTTENAIAWNNLGKLPWYQPVTRTYPGVDVLLQHPTDKCVDNETPQPLIAVRKYGKGEVVYLGFNEFWRLRKKYGEKYYRQFWAQLIYRLGLGRAYGAQKRFQVATDRKQYETSDKVRITVEAYNENFQKLESDRLEAKLITETEGGSPQSTEISIARREGNYYEATLPLYTASRHRVLVRDPVTREEFEVNFKVAPATLERRSAVRDYKLQLDLAAATGGKSYELHEFVNLPDDLKDAPPPETYQIKKDLWNTWFTLSLVLLFLMLEWGGRKLVNLR
ncbi:MAG: BatA domain-containing protein [Phycisphaeraceae bacterium]